MAETTALNLIKFLRSTSLFGQVDADLLTLLADRLTPVAVPAGEVLLCEGEPGDCLYLLQTGKLNVYQKDQEGNDILLSSVLPGESVGEIGMLTGANRSANVCTAESSLLWQLTRHVYEQISAADPVLRSAVESAIALQLQRVQLRAVLYANQPFAEFDHAVLRDIEQSLDWVSLTAGETLFCAGEASDALYIVLSGCLRIISGAEPCPTCASAPSELEMGNTPKEVGGGEIIGELGLISGEPRTATLVAVRKTLLGRLARDAFYRLLRKHPKDLLRLTSTRIAADYRNTIIRATESRNAMRSFALFAVGEDVPVSEFAEQLTGALSAYGSAVHIDEVHTDLALNQPGISHAPFASAADGRLALWFGEQEANHKYLVYSCRQRLIDGGTVDPAENPWSERCAQRADHIVYLAWADGKPRAVCIAPDTKTQRSLVLLHPPSRRTPTGTKRWLEAVRPDLYHHVRWQARDLEGADRIGNNVTSKDLSRLARLITGRGIGLVLSGGGARGYAHVGAIRALEEANIPIDLVGGTSMGALVAGLHAIGLDAASMTAALVTHLSHRKHLTDLTLPMTSILAGQKLETIMRTLFGNLDIVDAWRAFFCITTDITYASEVVHRSGAMWRYIRASMSMPVAFPPQTDGDHLLIDGCIMNNYPANVMHNSFGCGTVIGVNVCLELDLYGKNQYGNSLSGWKILGRKLNPFSAPVNAPSVWETLYRLLDINTAERSEEQRRLTDVYIRPPVELFQAHDFEKYQTIMDAGYQAARSELDRQCVVEPERGLEKERNALPDALSVVNRRKIYDD